MKNSMNIDAVAQMKTERHIINGNNNEKEHLHDEKQSST